MSVQILNADATTALRGLPDRSVHCVVTSPPYYGLRSYGIEPSVWLPRDLWDCPVPVCPDGHSWGKLERGKKADRAPVENGTATNDRLRSSEYAQGPAPLDGGQYCETCGSWLGTLGNEPTPQLYIDHLVEIFREVRRVLRDDGTLWLNLGDSYAATHQGRAGDQHSAAFHATGEAYRQNVAVRRYKGIPPNLKPKDLIGIPWRVAFALQDDGWWLRRDNLWVKPNPMPESVTDRCTTSHEYVFHLSKSADYFYDHEAVKEPSAEPDRVRYDQIGGVTGQAVRYSPGGMIGASATRNRRSVWTINAKPFRGAHFATFPPDLVRIPIEAGTSERGVCRYCGAPWGRVLRRTKMVFRQSARGEEKRSMGLRTALAGTMIEPPRSHTVGWRPTCRCPGQRGITARAVVMDPFAGSGTTAMVSLDLGRDAIAIEPNPDYCRMIEARASQESFF